MSVSTDVPTERGPDVPVRAPAPVRRRRHAIARAMASDRIGAVYVWIVLIIAFSLLAPSAFPSLTTAKQVANTYAVTGMAALAITLPLATRTFDLSIASVINLTGVSVAYLQVHGLALVPAVALALLVGLAMGAINAIVIVGMKIDAFIGTLATGSLIQALVLLITNDIPITSLHLALGPFSRIGQAAYGGVTIPVVYLIVIAAIVWYVLEHTATGRRMYAVGFNPDAARLARVRVDRLRVTALLVSGFVAGLTGVVLASTVSSGSPDIGTPYLIPVYASAFLGATQLRHGRFNAGGTIIAVMMLGTGVVGLGLAGAQGWAQQMFIGVVLIASLALTGVQRRGAATVLPTRLLARVRGRAGRADGRPTDARPTDT